MTNHSRAHADFGDHIGFIWSIAELLRGNYKQSEYGKVVLPFTVLRRLDCVLAPTQEAVQAKLASLSENIDDAMRETTLNLSSGHEFHNTSPFTFEKLLHDPDNIAANLNNMINGFSQDARDIFIDRFGLPEQIARLDRDNLLYLIVSRFAQADLHPDRVSNLQMGYIFEELIRRFSEQSNETAGEHFTPREVIRLMVNLLFLEDNDALTKPGIIRNLYDPACGTGGMLSIAEEDLRELNPRASLIVYGQELNDESYATCKSDMMIKGHNAKNIYPGNSLTQDGLPDMHFDYMLSNPPFGVEWRKIESAIKAEAQHLGSAGRFGAGLPKVNDGSLLFVQHMISKFHQNDNVSRLAVVLNGSPLFSGAAGSGESEIRRWIVKSDYLEAIIALPPDMFYNTGIATYIWIITNRKTPQRAGKVQLIDATDFSVPMSKSLGSKRKQISDDQIAAITRLFGNFAEVKGRVKIFDNIDFGYQRVTIERPLKLNFQIGDDRLAVLKSTTGFARLPKEQQRRVLAVLASLDNAQTYKNRDAFAGLLTDAFTKARVNLTAAQQKAICHALGERDETAAVCTNRKGDPDPDPELRDYETVPLREDVDAYFEREVRPHIPDAWIDHSKTKVGYEIPFNRHFYTFAPPRELTDIDTDLKGATTRIAEMKRQAVISNAVTKGLNPNATMKDSGIEWIGKVPAHWEVKKLKYVCLSSALYGANIAATHYQETGIRFLRTTDITDDGQLKKEGVFLPEELVRDYILNDGDILLSRSGTVGRSFLYQSKLHGPCAYAGYLVRFVPNPHTLPRYVFFFTKTHAFERFLRLMAISATIENVNADKYANVHLPIPPLEEQEEIADYLDRETKQIDALIEEYEMAIGLLKERRTALISAAVTGAIDVRNVG